MVRYFIKVLTSLIAFTVILSLIFFFANRSYAKVSGECSNCHTMHNSQNGTQMIIGYNPDSGTGPYDNLMRVNGCLGCHAATEQTTSTDSLTGAPIVLNAATDGPSYGARYKSEAYQGLAGGNFYWVWAGDDTKGHNIFSSNPDDYLSDAPGRPSPPPGPGRCSNNDSCHVNLNKPYEGAPLGLTGRQGCTGCHMVDDDNKPSGYHHADDSDTVINDFPWYRFLGSKIKHNQTFGAGVSGIENSQWELDASSTAHNEYKGEYESGGNNNKNWSISNHTITAFCCGCHGNFHIQEESGAWIRHPSDAVIPSLGEYSAYTNFNPQAPVARPELEGWEGPRKGIYLDEDLVMCLSCHRPHGSPYPDLLRWNYNDMLAGGEDNDSGCFICHSQKDNS